MTSVNRNMAIIAIMIVILLLLSPARWTFLTQLPTSTRSIVDDAAPASIASTPLEHDLEAQIANAIRQDNQSTTQTGGRQLTQWSHLIALQKQIPDQPAILATLLRLQMSEFHDGQMKGAQFREEGGQGDHGVPDDPEFLMALETEAVKGERIAPNNAFFSFMRAAPLFAMGQDNAALKAIGSAGKKTEWNEYVVAEPAGNWKLAAQASHGPKSIRDLAIESSVMFPQYARLRNTAASAINSAMLLEEKGEAKEALRIRLSVMQLGGLMRSTQAQSAITVLVGIAITNIAIERPGGAPKIKASNSNDQQKIVTAKRLAIFADYLRRTGNADAIGPVTEELSRGEQAKDIIFKGIHGNNDLDAFTRYGAWWLAGSVFLQNLIVLCLFIAIAGWVGPRIHGPASQKIAAALGGAAIIGASVPFLVPTTAGGTFLVYYGEALLSTAIAAVALCLIEYRLLGNVEDRKPVMGLCVLVAVVTTAVVWPISYAFGKQFGSLLELISDNSDTGPVVVPYGIAISVLLWIGVSIVCLVRRIPIASGFAQAFVKSGRIIALIMLIVYAGYAVAITGWDQRLDRVVRERTGHEVARAAASTHQTWPPITDFSDVRVFRG